ncbi:hypothetical protein RHORCCE3_2448 [Rickettsia hoogstraalii str. RCCE3]|nr:hypothetical protein RHORCCE3_2448 [Rickettsia hoogstraalii str. RCCE3]
MQNIDSKISAIQEEINSILTLSVQSLEAQHRIIIEGGSIDKKMESEQEDDSRVSIGEQSGTSGILREN